MAVNRTYLSRPGSRLWPRLRLIGDCLEWQGSTNEHGYGSIRVNKKLIKAHRFAYELAYGPIPDGMDVLHHCDNPPCCRPDHLFRGTAADNGRDMVAKGRHGSWRHPEQMVRGERHHQAKLTAQQVTEIRRCAQAPRSISGLAREYGMSRAAIRNIRDGKTWREAA